MEEASGCCFMCGVEIYCWYDDEKWDRRWEGSVYLFIACTGWMGRVVNGYSSSRWV